MVQLIQTEGRVIVVVNGATVGEVVPIEPRAPTPPVDPWWTPADELAPAYPPLPLVPWPSR